MKLKDKVDKEYKDEKKFLIITIMIWIISIVAIIINSIKPNFITWTMYCLILTICFIISLIAVIIIPQFICLVKLKKDEEYNKIILGKCKDMFPDLYTIELYFTDKYIVDICGFVYTKIDYNDIAIAYIEEGYKGKIRLKTYYICIINQELEKKVILIGAYVSKTKAEIVLEEIKKRVPNVLIGNSKENINKIKNIK